MNICMNLYVYIQINIIKYRVLSIIYINNYIPLYIDSYR